MQEILLLYIYLLFAFSVRIPELLKQPSSTEDSLESTSCKYPTVIPCPPPENICSNDTLEIVVPLNATYDCQIPLNLTAPEVTIKGALALRGGVNIVADVVNIGYLNCFDSSYVKISGAIFITEIFTIFLSRNQSFATNLNQSQILISLATITTQKFLVESYFISIRKSSLLTVHNECLYEVLSTTSFLKSESDMEEYFEVMLNLPISVVLYGHENIEIFASSLVTNVISIYSENTINVNQSIINNTATSCFANLGLGKGLETQISNEVTCSSGGSSAGYGTLSSEKCASTMQYFMFLTHSFPYLSKGPYLCTGSGGYGYKEDIKDAGAGGGIIFIYSSQSFSVHHSQFLVEGGLIDGNYNISAGSGGTIFLYTNILIGDYANFSAAGGSSTNNNGSGAGGIIKISYETRQYSTENSMWVNVSQGYQPIAPSTNVESNGIYYGVFCGPGFYPLYLNCIKCEYGTYSMLGDTSCQNCPSAFGYLGNSNKSADGIYNISLCFSEEGETLFEIWIEPRDLYWSSIVYYIITLIVTIIFGLLIKKKYKKKLTVLETEDFSIEDAKKDKDLEETKILTERLKMERNIKFEDLMYHIHRITLFGSNNAQCPWGLPQYPPEQIKKYILRQGFIDFSEKFNKVAKWTTCEKIVLNIALLIYPLHWFYYDKIKKLKYKKLLALLEESKEFNLINNYDFEDKNMVTIKISKNADYTICYLDFMVYDRADTKYFNLSSPYIVTISGEGNFLRPFYLEDRDVFFNTLFYIVDKAQEKNESLEDEKKELFRNLVLQKKKQENRNKLIDFLKRFNTISITLDLSAPLSVFIQTLVSLIDYLTIWNESYFKELNIHLDLILMISKVKKGILVSNEIHILTHQNPEMFDEFMRKNLPNMNRYEKYDVKLGLFVYNPDQEINKTKNNRKSTIPNLKKSWIGGDLITGGLDEDDVEVPLVETEENIELIKKEKKVIAKCLKSIQLGLNFVRYTLLTHRKLSSDKEMTKFIVTTVVLFQCMLVFTWSMILEGPYIFSNLVAPFIGLLWMVSGSYGIGKLFLILNAMALLSEFVTLIAYLILQLYKTESSRTLARVATGCLMTILLKIITIPLATKFLSVSRKLSTSKMFK